MCKYSPSLPLSLTHTHTHTELPRESLHRSNFVLAKQTLLLAQSNPQKCWEVLRLLRKLFVNCWVNHALYKGNGLRSQMFQVNFLDLPLISNLGQVNYQPQQFLLLKKLGKQHGLWCDFNGKWVCGAVTGPGSVSSRYDHQHISDTFAHTGCLWDASHSVILLLSSNFWGRLNVLWKQFGGLLF